MPVERIQKITRSFRTSDGCEFGDHREAVEYENYLSLCTWCRENLELPDKFQASVIARRMSDDKLNLLAILKRKHGSEPTTFNKLSTEEVIGAPNSRRNRKKG